MMGLIETTTTRLDMHDLVRPPSPPPSATAAAAASTCCLPASGLQANTRQASPALSASSRLSSCRFSFRKLQISRRGSPRICRVTFLANYVFARDSDRRTPTPAPSFPSCTQSCQPNPIIVWLAPQIRSWYCSLVAKQAYGTHTHMHTHVYTHSCIDVCAQHLAKALSCAPNSGLHTHTHVP